MSHGPHHGWSGGTFHPHSCPGCAQKSPVPPFQCPLMPRSWSGGTCSISSLLTSQVRCTWTTSRTANTNAISLRQKCSMGKKLLHVFLNDFIFPCYYAKPIKWHSWFPDDLMRDKLRKAEVLLASWL